MRKITTRKGYCILSSIRLFSFSFWIKKPVLGLTLTKSSSSEMQSEKHLKTNQCTFSWLHTGGAFLCQKFSFNTLMHTQSRVLHELDYRKIKHHNLFKKHLRNYHTQRRSGASHHLRYKDVWLWLLANEKKKQIKNWKDKNCKNGRNIPETTLPALLETLQHRSEASFRKH